MMRPSSVCSSAPRQRRYLMFMPRRSEETRPFGIDELAVGGVVGSGRRCQIGWGLQEFSGHS